MSVGIVLRSSASQPGSAFKLEPAEQLAQCARQCASLCGTVDLVCSWLVKTNLLFEAFPSTPLAGAARSLLRFNHGWTGVRLQARPASPVTVFQLCCSMGVRSLGARVPSLLIYLKLRLSSSQDAPSALDIGLRHWRYGRWALGANAMMWIPIHLVYPLLSRYSGMAQAGELQALKNLASPMLQTCAALSLRSCFLYSARVLEQERRCRR